MTSVSLGTGTPSAGAAVHKVFTDSKFHAVTKAMQATLNERLSEHDGILFRVDAGDLFDVYLEQFIRADYRQYHNCNCCHSFLRQFGSLVVITEHGTLRSALWDEKRLPSRHVYRNVVKTLRQVVERGSITEQFRWSDNDWGTPEAGGFSHFSARAMSNYAWKRRDIHAWQAMAESRENFRILGEALGAMPSAYLYQAASMLRSGELNRGEKFAEWADWLIALQGKLRDYTMSSEHGRRLLWLEVARAPAGWCSPRSSALGALVEDLASPRMSMPTIVHRHNSRVDPLSYQRPTSIKAGNVEQAERLFEEMGLATALRRRPALASEVEYAWVPPQPNGGSKGGIFGHLRRQSGDRTAGRALNTRPVNITFAKFARDVLPRAREMEALVPGSRGQFCAYTTQADPDASPILQWDNPFAWYVYHGGSAPSQWGLRGLSRVRVLGISELPCHWSDPQKRHFSFGNRALLVLGGCADSRNDSLALFPECLRQELHKVRATIEAHSRSTRLEPVEGQRASGLLVGDGAEVIVHARTAGGVETYRIDRWE